MRISLLGFFCIEVANRADQTVRKFDLIYLHQSPKISQDTKFRLWNEVLKKSSLFWAP